MELVRHLKSEDFMGQMKAVLAREGLPMPRQSDLLEVNAEVLAKPQIENPHDTDDTTGAKRKRGPRA